MNPSQINVIHNYFENLQLELLFARYSKVSEGWHREERVSDYNRLYYFIDGDGWMKIDGKEYRPVPGQLFILPANTPLAFGTVRTNPFSKHWCHFLAKIGQFHLFELLPFPYYIQVKDTEYMCDLFERLQQAYQKNGDLASPLKIRSILFEILSYFVENMPQDITITTSHSLTRSNQILQYIEAHLSEPLTLKHLAKVFSYNPNYFIRYFKSMFNLSPNQYISKIRIEKAKKLLTQTDLSVETIAMEIGWERFYFSKVFKQFTSLSPIQYRNFYKNQI